VPQYDIQQRRAIPYDLQATGSRVMFQPEPVFFYLEKFLIEI
jgi:hypothetical protein